MENSDSIGHMWSSRDDDPPPGGGGDLSSDVDMSVPITGQCAPSSRPLKRSADTEITSIPKKNITPSDSIQDSYTRPGFEPDKKISQVFLLSLMFTVLSLHNKP
ncbi:unnamed protein product, partial [Iphiclides podalirius]